MKVNFILFAFSLLTSINLLAQPTVTRDWFGSIGDKVSTTFSTTVPSIEPGGANLTWDYSEIIPDTISLTFDYIDPATTPSGSEYPMSNISIAETTLGIYGYVEITNSVLQNYGSSFITSETVYTDPQVELVFPLNYTDTFEDDYTSVTSLFGVMSHSKGHVEGEADAYGTVILPNGTFENVMRVKIVVNSEDSTDLGFGIVEKIITETTSYYWYSADHPGPLCYFDYTEGLQVAIVEGLPNDTLPIDTETSFAFDPTAGTSATPFFGQDAFSLKASPNPFAGELSLFFAAEASGELEFELRNSLGQSVIHQAVSASAGKNSLNFSTAALPPGPYYAILKSNEQGSVIKLIKAE